MVRQKEQDLIHTHILRERLDLAYLLKAVLFFLFKRDTHLRCLIAQLHPLSCGKMHCLRHTIATTHLGHEGPRETHHELAALLHRPVHLHPFST